MKTRTIGILLALAAGLALAAPLAAQQTDAPEQGAEDAEARLKDAQARLEAAAREIAELSAQIVGDAGLHLIEEFAGRPRRAMLGVSIGPAGGKEAREDGVQVLGVTPDGPADAAGIRSGDVLVSVGAVELDWAGDSSPSSKLLDALRAVEPGAEVTLGYRRDGQVASALVTTRPWSPRLAFSFDGDRLTPPTAPEPPGMPEFMHRLMMDRWGDMELVSLSPELGEYFEAKEGVLVVRAPRDSSLGLKDGDVIVDIAGRKPADPAHVVRILRSYAPGEHLVMTVIRKGKRQQLEADVPARPARG
jgi:S1-C subfamily serine protease